MKIRWIWDTIKSAATNFINDDALTLSAALAFYTALSLAPLLLVAVWILSLVYGGEQAQQHAAEQARQTIGTQSAGAVQAVMANASQQKGQSLAAAIIGISTFVFSASGVFAQLQYSLNRVWNVKARGDAPWWNWFRQRFWTLVLLAIIGAVLLASVAATAVLSGLQNKMQSVVNWPGLWWGLNVAVPFVIYIFLFAMIYKFLPDVKIAWSNVWIGAIITAVLFSIGKYLIGWYIGRGTISSVYGAAGSLIALLTWLYYSALIFFFGAELTQSYAQVSGSDIEPSGYADWTKPQEGPQ